MSRPNGGGSGQELPSGTPSIAVPGGRVVALGLAARPQRLVLDRLAAAAARGQGESDDRENDQLLGLRHRASPFTRRSERDRVPHLSPSTNERKSEAPA